MTRETLFFTVNVETDLSWRCLKSTTNFFYGFSSVYTYPLLLLFLYRMTITSRFTMTFVVGSIISKCTLENYTIFHPIPIAIECWLRETSYRKILSATTQLCGPGSSVGIANAYGLDGPGIESRCGEIFRTSPDRHWGPSSLLYN